MPDFDAMKWDEDKEGILGGLDDATAPEVMSKRDALECYEDLMSDLKVRVEALRGEVETEGEPDEDVDEP